ncbi:MAG TPA: hypothetical protein VMJ34_21600 [Bryobacteraceae bacterium]|nr:hypothetical protein [Bryobacteraceae bacterium]
MAALLAGAVLSAETFKVNITDKVQVGQTQLQPGKYLLEVDGSSAVLKDKSGKAIDAKTKVEQTDKKASETKIGVKTSQATELLESITPKGGRVRVTFE